MDVDKKKTKKPRCNQTDTLEEIYMFHAFQHERILQDEDKMPHRSGSV